MKSRARSGGFWADWCEGTVLLAQARRGDAAATLRVLAQFTPRELVLAVVLWKSLSSFVSGYQQDLQSLARDGQWLLFQGDDGAIKTARP